MATIRKALWLLSVLMTTVVARNNQTTESNQSEDPLQCQTQRAPDYYGLGVRLGIYFMWVSAYVANTMLPAEIPGALDQNAVWLFAILIAMVKCTVSGMLEQIDGLILMHMAGGTIFSIFTFWGYRTVQYRKEGPSAIRHYGGFGTHARLLLSLGIACYGLWFWLEGVKGSLSPMGPEDDPPNPEACGTLYTFMFAKVRADGGIRIFYIIICTCCIVVFGFQALASTIAGFSRGQKMLELWKTKQFATSTRLRFATGFKYKELKFISKFWKWWAPIFIVYSILLIECSLNFNNVNSVLGGPNDNELHLPAQLLPLLIGTFSFVRIIWLTFTAWRSPTDTNPSTFEDGHVQMRNARTLRMGIGFLQLFSPSLAADAPKDEEIPEDAIDPREKRKSTIVRYLVAMYPWLSLLNGFSTQADGSSVDASGKKSTDLESPPLSPVNEKDRARLEKE